MRVYELMEPRALAKMAAAYKKRKLNDKDYTITCHKCGAKVKSTPLYSKHLKDEHDNSSSRDA